MTTQRHAIAHTNAPVDRTGTFKVVCTCGRVFTGSTYDVAEQIWRAHRTTAEQQIGAFDATFADRARDAAATIREAISLGHRGPYFDESFGSHDLERIADEHDRRAADGAGAEVEALAADLDTLYRAGWRRTDTP